MKYLGLTLLFLSLAGCGVFRTGNDNPYGLSRDQRLRLQTAEAKHLECLSREMRELYDPWEPIEEMADDVLTLCRGDQNAVLREMYAVGLPEAYIQGYRRGAGDLRGFVVGALLNRRKAEEKAEAARELDVDTAGKTAEEP